jgi:hypothetical protein
MHLVLVPDHTDTATGNDTDDPTDTCTRQAWHLERSSHVAVARRADSVATPVPVTGGALDLDPDGGVGTLHIEIGGSAGGFLRAVIFGGEDDATGFPVWMVSGTLSIDGITSPVILELRDHGAVDHRGVWRWLSGTGLTPESGRRRRCEVGSPLVVDLLFAAAIDD